MQSYCTSKVTATNWDCN